MSNETEATSPVEATPATPPAPGPATPGEAADGFAEGQATLPPEQVAALQEKAAQAEALRDRYLRTMAEFENFRKRAARERQEAVQFANQSLMERLVPALDNLDMALAAVSSAQGGTVEGLKTGVEMVLGQLRGVLREAGLEEISALGQAFDPTWHEAVSQVDNAEVPEGQVVQQLRKGYRLQQRLLRPATVIIARKPENGPSA